jgi:hypothetical protein
MQEIAEMTVEQLLAKKDWLERGFQDCRESGHGVSTKERVWYQFVLERLLIAGVDVEWLL